jgi:dihydrolipoamide dehydrogenase
MGKTYRCDVAVVGAGSAGLSAYRAAERRGAHALLIEARRHGTACAWDGCMPSKLLIAAGHAANAVHHAERFGVSVAGRQVDGSRVMARVRAERDRFVGLVVASVDRIPSDRKLVGRARFVGPAELELDDGTRISARAVVVATGSRPRSLPLLSGVTESCVTSDDVFELPALPESLLVIGAGTIGLELGQAFTRLGVRTTVIETMDHFSFIPDDVIRAVAERELAAELCLNLGSALEAAERAAAGAKVRWHDASGTLREDSFERILVAVGREPQVAGLELAQAGVELDARGLPIFDPGTMRCGMSAVYVAGDATGTNLTLHRAAEEGRVAGTNAAAGAAEASTRLPPLDIVFTDPQIAFVGARPTELEPGSFAVGEADYSDQGRARVMAQNRGLLRVYGSRASGCILGAEMVAPGAEHLAHLLAWLVEDGATVSLALERSFYHPVLEEGLRTALRSLSTSLEPA